jgi:FkbM family methyltransferase
MIENHHCSVFGFDPTPKSIQWISSQTLPSEFKFFPYGLAPKSGVVEFYLPQNSDYVSGSILKNQNINTNQKIQVPMKSFPDILSDFKHDKIDVLKMDIEGAEYDVLAGVLASNVVIDQILLEFHHRVLTSGKAKTLSAVRLLKDNGYEIFSISDTQEEVSFIRKK